MQPIAELYAKNPFDIDEKDLDEIIEYYRRRRAEFQLTGKAPKTELEPVDLKKLGLL